MVKSFFMHVGNGNLVPTWRVVRVESCRERCIRKLKRTAMKKRMLIDACAGQHAQSFIFLDSRHVVVSPMAKQEVVQLLQH